MHKMSASTWKERIANRMFSNESSTISATQMALDVGDRTPTPIVQGYSQQIPHALLFFMIGLSSGWDKQVAHGCADEGG